MTARPRRWCGIGRPGRILLASLATLVALAGGASGATAATGTPGGRATPLGGGTRAAGGRLLVLSLPTLAWSEVHSGNTPNLDRLLDRSAVGAMSVRGVGPRTDADDAYATMSAGTRARGVQDSALVLGSGEPYLDATAGEVYERGTARDPADGLVALGAPALLRRNDRLNFDAEIGRLGQQLADAGVARAVVANADEVGSDGRPIRVRTAGTALADRDGLIPRGEVSELLNEADAASPWGQRLSVGAVTRATRAALTPRSVVLVEASDLVRAERYRSATTSSQVDAMRVAALRHSDDLVGSLLGLVDPERDSVLVLSPYHRRGRPHLTVAALSSPRVDSGWLRSGTTRRSRLVALVDMAPTVLDLVGLERDDSMEGRRFEVVDDGGGDPAERAEALGDLGARAVFRDKMVAPVATTFVIAQAGLWVLTALALRSAGGDRRWLGRVVSGLAVALLVFLPATYLAGPIGFHGSASGAYWAFIAAVSAALSALAHALGRRGPLDPLLVALGLVFGTLVVDMVRGAPWQLNTVFGYSPTVGGRFAGMGNLAFGQFAGSAMLLYGLVRVRFGSTSRVGRWALAVLGLAVVIDGMPIWGSDVGGVLALVPAIGVTLGVRGGRRLGMRNVVAWGSAAVAAVVAFALFDLSRPEDRRTHLGRLAESLRDNGFEALETVATRKLGANLAVLTSSVWTAMVPIVLGFIAYLIWRAPGQLRVLRELLPDTVRGLAVVALLGFALNDSGIAVPGVMLGVVNASLAYLVVRRFGADAAAAGP